MSTFTNSRFLRFLLLLVARLRLSVVRATLVFRAQFASFWKSILTPDPFATRRRSQSQIRLCSSNSPAVGNNTHGQHPRNSEDNETLAIPPLQPVTPWKDRLSLTYPAPSSNFQLKPIPTTPEKGSWRYEPEELGESDPSPIQAGQIGLLSTLRPLPDGWKRFVHPEGNVLYYHEGLRVFTENDVTNKEYEGNIISCALKLIQIAIEANDKVEMGELTEIVLNLDVDEKCHYYFVDHTNRLLFWVNEIDKPVEFFEIKSFVIAGPGHIKYMVEAKYWAHCQYYPHNRTLPKGVLRDLRGILNYAKTDVMTADTSTSPFAQDKLVAILDLVNSFKDGEKISDPYSIWIVGRLMLSFTEAQFFNFCGLPYARLNAETSLFEDRAWNGGWPFRIVDLLLFRSPNEHAVRLQRVWVDGIIVQSRWKDFVNRLTDEFTLYTIFSTVMLTVNFGFLAPGLITSSLTTTPIQIMIYSSEVATIGSIAFSLVLLKTYGNPGLLNAGRTAEALRAISRGKWGMAGLSVVHGLPMACLVWSMALFSVALLMQIFSQNGLGIRVALSVECLILVLLGYVGRDVIQRFSGDSDADDANTVSARLLARMQRVFRHIRTAQSDGSV